MLGEIYCWIWRAGLLLCLAVGGFVPLAAPPKNGPMYVNTKVILVFFLVISRIAHTTWLDPFSSSEP
jgi:hypothetical protein